MIIAIDGPAASGKSTTAKLVGQKMDFLYIDTGAMYRAMALKAYKMGVDYEDSRLIKNIMLSTVIDQKINKDTGDTVTLLDQVDVSHEIRTPEISKGVTAVCEIKEVRDNLVEIQRDLGNKGDVILDGRDIGTVVFPNADLKFFMIADVDIRAERRFKEMQHKGMNSSLEDIKADIIRRDDRDSTRSNSPLKAADDAILIDTSKLTIDEQVEFIIEKIKERS
ncbi:MAG: (d)CMP kinase [Candidatus Delongbacteria bacterium]|jgi:cytidylate kinase|nr:(d)CMP kinase [Candidatus Delongbacteria bacterium]